MYRVTKSVVKTDDGKFRIMYGIRSKNISYKSITADKRKIKQLCAVLNRLKLSEIHFKDVIEDAIDEFAFDIHEEKHL